MSGLDKIIEHIESSATEIATQIVEDAKKEAEKIVSEGKAAADAKAEEIIRQGRLDTNAQVKKIQSEANLAQKRFMLKSKQSVVNEVFDTALQNMKSLDNGSYFGIILKMISNHAGTQSGMIRFSQKDLDRLPEDFELQVNEYIGGRVKLTISDEPADIDSGFILDYGNIEENCSFDALFDDSKEELQDKISQIIFG